LLAAALALVVALAAAPALAQQGGEIVTVKRGGYTISGLVDLQPGAKPKRGIALFPGSPGIMKLHLEGGQPAFALGGNFLFRTRQWWLDADTLTVAVDAPSDQWTTFEQRFRQTARYGKDIAALLEAIGARYGVEDWTFVGTSEGTVSAFHAARMNPA